MVSKNTPWPGGYAAVNSFGFGGANVHVLLRSPSPALTPLPRGVLIPPTHRINHTQATNGMLTLENLAIVNGNDNSDNGLISECSTSNTRPRLVAGAGRTEEAVTTLLEGAKEKGNPALFSLLDKLSDMATASHPARGFTVVNSEKSVVQVMLV